MSQERASMADADSSLDELGQAMYECLERMESSGLAAIEETAGRRPRVSRRLRRRMLLLQRAGLLEPPRAEPSLERLGDFRLLRPLGSGGMGSVYLAWQESLCREVALKIVRADLRFFPTVLDRFRREANALSRLVHAGIVPFHAIGEHDGVPYLAMEHVRGATLAEILGELDGRRPSSLSGADLLDALRRVLASKGFAPDAAQFETPEGSWPRVCVALAEQVARALDHAHRHGVLHRDVKPSNVMLTVDGRTKLFDFGLARTEGASKLTQTGTPVGTLPYMAPEQLAGGVADPRTDVYGVGVSLYELLMLRPAFDGEHELELRARVLAGTIRGLRRLEPSIPPDIESVCLKALDSDPRRRYASAADLARDLRNVLELRPVSARPHGPWLRARRWMQRHPTRTVAAAALVVIVLGGPLAYALQRNAAARRIELALDDARAQRTRAEQNLRRAREAVVYLLAEVGNETLAEIPGMAETRARLFERSLAMLGELMPQRAGDPELELQRALLLRESANLLEHLERVPEAIAAYEESIAILRARSSEGRRADRIELAAALGNLASTRNNADEFEAALALGREAIDALESANDGADARVLAGLALLRCNRAETWARLDRFGEALPELDAALAAAERLRELDPSPASLFALADCHGRRGFVRQASGDAAGAIEAYAAALPAYRELAARARPAQEHLRRMTVVCRDYSWLLWQADRWSESDDVARAGLAASEQLIREHPYIEEYRTLFGDALQAQAFALAARDRLVDALPLFQRAVETFAEQVEFDPADATFARRHAQALANLANASLDLDLRDQARTASEAAVVAFDRLLAADADDAALLESSVFARLVRDQSRLELRQYPDAAELEAWVRERAADEPRAFVSLAIVLCAAVASSRSDPALDFEERARREQAWVERALALLDEAVERGYSSAERLESTRELDVLRDQPAYRRLIERLR